MTWLAILSFVLAAVTFRVFLRNARLFQTSPTIDGAVELPPVSILIPARNEEQGITQTLESVLASQGLDFELIVLDDHSTDDTAKIIRASAASDRRLRLIDGRPLPQGWCGKQHACQQLADSATHKELVFLDADVHVRPDAIGRAVAMRRAGDLGLLSGFPQQITESFGERLLLPLINYILLCYLPFRMMRDTTSPSASAGCGQFFVTNTDAYRTSGGHAAIRASLHDGVTLPRAFRRKGLSTDVFDASDVASVRMYRGFGETWSGLSKNAHEGVANARLIVPVTLMLFVSHLLPAVIMVSALFFPVSWLAITVSLVALTFSLIPRVAVAGRYGGTWIGVILHPASIATFLAIQWTSFISHLLGVRSQWRGRSYSTVENVVTEEATS